ncbi:MAG: helix-turn-helix domain-containing protein [Prevotella sp.]
MSRRAILFYIVGIWCLHLWASPECRITRYDENSGLPSSHITKIIQDRQGFIWIATWNGLCRFDGQAFTLFKTAVGDGCDMPNDRFRNIFVLPSGNIGCMVDNRFFEFDMCTCRFTEVPSLTEKNRRGQALLTRDTYQYTDRFGAFWTIHRNGTITCGETTNGRQLPYVTPYPLGPITYCMPDDQGNLWLIGNGCVYHFVFFSQPDSPWHQSHATEVRAFYQDSRQQIWLSCRTSSSLRLYDMKGNALGYVDADGMLRQGEVPFRFPVFCITQVSDSVYYVGGKPGGVWRMKRLSPSRYQLTPVAALGQCSAYYMLCDRQHRLWVATIDSGVHCVVDPLAAHPTVLSPGKGLWRYPTSVCQRARHLHISYGGMLLVSTTEGLLVADLYGTDNIQNMNFQRHVREANRVSSLSCSAVMQVAEDSRHLLYVCTESGGVNQVLTPKATARQWNFRHFTARQGLVSDVVRSAIPIDSLLLVVCSKGVSLLHPQTGRCHSFGHSFFHHGLCFSDAIPVCLPDSSVLLGLQNDALAIPLSLFRSGVYMPPLALTDITVQEENPSVDMAYADTITLYPRQRSISVGFAALDFAASGHIDYAYRLYKDEQTPWNHIGHNRSVTLLDLQPGTYILQLRSTDVSGEWADNLRTLVILVPPTFWETGYATLLWIVLTVLFFAICAYIIYYIRRIRKRQRETLNAYLALLDSVTGESSSMPQKMVVPRNENVAVRVSDADHRMMQRVTAYVEEHLGDAEMGVAQMSEAAAMSRSVLQRKMKSLMGVTPGEFLRQARIRKACQLLQTTSLTVSEIAFQCGFTDPKYFSRMFRQSMGITPTEYKNGSGLTAG